MQDLACISGLFEGPEGHMMTQTASNNLKLLEENKYLLDGRLVGMSLMQDGPGLGCLDPTLYKLICGLPYNHYDFDVDVITDVDFVQTGTVISLLNFRNKFHMHCLLLVSS